ncbi:hypothetical protein SCB49_13945 [unidentified eubacterium SCB49]|nr:hypothetical protein SCB49_13945 [unidentified eubacterium SCB49]
MDNQHKLKLAKAKKKIKDIKGFHTHLAAYILVNIFILAVLTNFFTNISFTPYAILNYLSTPVLWGIGLLFHAIVVFVPAFGFIKNWEERKLKQLMNEDNDTHLSS